MSFAPNGHPRELLSEYLDDELGLEERGAIDRHLAACEDCREQLEALRRLARAVADESVPPVPSDLAVRIGRRLDTATIVRPRRSRFFVPATIAATVGAIGLLIVLQWREGHVGAPAQPEPEPRGEAHDLAHLPEGPPPPPAHEAAPASPPARSKQNVAARTDSLEKDVEKKLEAPEENVPTSAPGGVVGGVVGGVESGVEGGVPADERRERAAAKVATEAGGRAMQAPMLRAKSDAVSACGDRWSDSGLRATWAVRDAGTAARELDRIAHDVGGIGQWRGQDDGRPYLLIVPRGRFEEVYFALRARGVAGLLELPALAEGGGCAGISVALQVIAAESSPAPR